VVELFEARVPKGEAVLSEIEGEIDVIETPGSRAIRVSSLQEYSDEYELPEGYELQVNDGVAVSIGETLAVAVAGEDEEAGDDALALPADKLVARESGIVSLGEGRLTIAGVDEDVREYTIPAAARIIVSSGDAVQAGDALTSGNLSPQRILAILGREEVERYLTDEVQRVYITQGVAIHDKHIEVIISQMLRKVRIDATGDTELLPGEYMDRQQFRETMDGILAEGGEPATASPVLLGITRASLNVESFLAMASFQETTRVLTESAINGEIDYLRGLKENVIIGRLIPARLDNTEEGREMLGIDDEEVAPPEPIGMLAQFPGEGPLPFGDYDLHDTLEGAPSPAGD
jgi:DNA-directed RNA polymerase subunit beta'